MVSKMGKVELYEDIYQKKFSFGKNWQDFLKNLDDSKIEYAKKSLSDFTGLENFNRKVFLDIGSGSGLFSLCAIKLGAKKVISVDIDINSINCAKYLRKKYGISEDKWEIRQGSALDNDFLSTLPKADILYSWGVLHHTGSMYKALDNVTSLTKKNGIFYLAIYNKFNGFPVTSKTWVKIKRFYSSSNIVFRKIMEFIYVSYYFTGLLIYGKNPYSYVKNYKKDSVRGMSFYRDVVDWLGGYPYEYASVSEIKKFYEDKGYKLLKVKRTTRDGCNEFLLKK